MTTRRYVTLPTIAHAAQEARPCDGCARTVRRGGGLYVGGSAAMAAVLPRLAMESRR